MHINIAMSLSYSALSTHQGLSQQRLNSRVLQTKLEDQEKDQESPRSLCNSNYYSYEQF